MKHYVLPVPKYLEMYRTYSLTVSYVAECLLLSWWVSSMGEANVVVVMISYRLMTLEQMRIFNKTWYKNEWFGHYSRAWVEIALLPRVSHQVYIGRWSRRIGVTPGDELLSAFTHVFCPQDDRFVHMQHFMLSWQNYSNCPSIYFHKSLYPSVNCNNT